MAMLSSAALSFAPALRVAPVQPAAVSVRMADDEPYISPPLNGEAYDFAVSYDRPMRFSNAPMTMGKEYVNMPRRPLSEYVGASVEFCAYPGAPDTPVAWDPMQFCELYKISGNNPDVAWMREAELKHGRMSMMAIVGVMVQEAGIHDPYWGSDASWYDAPTKVPLWASYGLLATIGLVEGTYAEGLYDLWNGQTDKREPGDYGWGKSFLSKDPVAADKMRLKELKNGRLAMIAIMGVAFNHVIPGAFPLSMYN